MKPRKWTEQQVKDWNKNHPVGSGCILVNDSGGQIPTWTRSEAWLLPWGGALVCLAGKSGGWDIDRVKFLEETK